MRPRQGADHRAGAGLLPQQRLQRAGAWAADLVEDGTPRQMLPSHGHTHVSLRAVPHAAHTHANVYASQCMRGRGCTCAGAAPCKGGPSFVLPVARSRRRPLHRPHHCMRGPMLPLCCAAGSPLLRRRGLHIRRPRRRHRGAAVAVRPGPEAVRQAVVLRGHVRHRVHRQPVREVPRRLWVVATLHVRKVRSG